MAAEAPGQFIIKYADQNESNPTNVFSAATAVISGGAQAAPTGATLTAIPYTLGGIQQKAGCRGRVLVYYKANASVTLASARCQWEIPMLLLDASGKVVDSMTLSQENMTGFTQAGATTPAVVINVPYRLSYYDVPRGLTMVLDPNGKTRAYFST